MSKDVADVTRKVVVDDVSSLPETDALPDRLQEAATLYHELGDDWVDELSRKAPVLRKGGYQLPTILLFFLALFTGDFRPSIKKVCRELSRRKNLLLAAFAGLKRFPQQSSVSRFLVRVQQGCLEQIMGWMLVFSHTKARDLVAHAACACRDAFGERWQLFDLDPTATVLRQRGLPEDEQLPPPQRTSEDIAEPGYTGRKRGDVVFRRTVLQHTGSALWLGSWLRRGTSGARETFAAAIRTVVECCTFAGFETARAILRIDGEGGNIPTITACMDAQISYLMRCVHYSILKRPEVRQQLITGDWYEVDDTGSGPRRWALDLGEVELFPGKTTLKDDGTPYEPVRARVVVSRFDASEKSSSGVLLDGSLFELFVTNLPAASWPAPDVVGLYCHRATEENRFGREDKELGLDTVFHNQPQGQALVTLIGLLVWNLRLILGFRAASPQLDDEPLAPGATRQPRPAELPIQPTDEHDDDQTEHASDGDKEVVSGNENPPGASAEPGRAEQDRHQVCSPEVTLDDSNHPIAGLEQLIRDAIDQTASGLSATGYDWDVQRGLTCRQDHVMEPVRTREQKGQAYLIFRAPCGVCGLCPDRQLCTRSADPQYRKERSVPVDDLRGVDELLGQLKNHHKPARRRRSSAPSKSRVKSLYTQEIADDFAPHIADQPGPYETILPMLNPAALRRRFAAAARHVSITVRTRAEPPEPPRRRYTYASRADRARSRRTWSERLAYNRRAAPVDVTVLRLATADTLFGAA